MERAATHLHGVIDKMADSSKADDFPLSKLSGALSMVPALSFEHLERLTVMQLGIFERRGSERDDEDVRHSFRSSRAIKEVSYERTQRTKDRNSDYRWIQAG